MLLKKKCVLILLMSNVWAIAQSTIASKTEIDSLFREDQLYVSFAYNLLQNKNLDHTQYSFSQAISLGFLRDMPVAKNRKWAIALGLGYAYNNIKHNLKINNDTPETYSFTSSYSRNNLVTHSVELPLEIRWRNATPTSHKFWRIYSGFKLSYIFYNQVAFQSSSENYKKKSSNLNQLQFGPYISIGYNSFNLYAYYALQPIFKNAIINDTTLKTRVLGLGFMFYIL